ncbi:vacuolar protein sorting-associated protein 8 homolog isoform X2 [Venturia canescens]|uniref:vacuolar protein sorting-associated protein 8 homolog isoform X2 n=1 Tax=Venturia canescens TaxID=32260 RepID=UPI001C9D1DBA|nr:vacuolar protein sorting-associated protein 8 homolog isoform X2 [Venturia canescens]
MYEIPKFHLSMTQLMLDDAEYAIPAVNQLPSLESILKEPDCGSLSGTDDDCLGAVSVDKLGSSETASVGSLLSLNSLNRGLRPPQLPPTGAILRHVILKGISAQIVSASERVNAGLASAVAAGGNMLVIGTSHGLVLGFDSTQTLRWCDQEARHQGSVSALCFNHDGSRLLAGFARGHILMIDSSNGKVLRTLTEVHPPGTAVLHVKFTDSPTLALCSDSGGSVFELSFTRVMGVRGCDSKCLFSGSRGEVCTLEPLLLNHLPSHPLKNYTLVALATLSKVIVVCIRPRMRVVLTHPLSGTSIAPPQVSWQLVVIQAADASRVIDPVLALARDMTVHFYQVCSEAGSRVRLLPLRRVVLSYTISNLRWLNARSLAILDTQERLHLLDVRTQDNLETLDMSRVGISYASSHFKGLSTGGNVSKAMALAGERACYNTVITFGTQLLLLGTKSLHAVCIRTWTERLRHLTMQRRFPEALALGLSFYQDKGKAVVGLRGSKQRRKQIARDKVCQVLIQYMEELNQCSIEDTTDCDIVTTCVDYCVQLENTELLFGRLWDLVSESESLKAAYLRALEPPLLDGSLVPRLPPLIAQHLVALYDHEERMESLQAIAVLLEVDCLDIHQVTTICRQRCLWEALIHLQTSALCDFTAPIHQLVPLLQTFITNSTWKETLPRDCIRLGNALLVYASCCLAGRAFPRGELPDGLPQRAKAEVLRALLSQHSSLASDSERQYPYLRTLLRFDARGFLDVIAIAFQEIEFKTEMGLRQRQRLVDILLGIVVPTTPLSPDNPDYLTDDQKATVLVFVANEVAEGNVSLEPSVLNRLVEVLTSDSANFTTGTSNVTRDRKIERENALLKLLHFKKLAGITDNTLLNLAQRANFLRVAELLYSARDDWTAVCRCLIADTYRHHEIWPWLESLPSSSFQHVVLAQASPLVKIDAAKLASLIATKASTKFTKILERLSNESTCLEYSLLSALYNITNYREDEEEDKKLELSTEQLENFLSLMCQHEPDKVVSHMNSHHGCRLDEALRIVREMGHREAEAVMLEKLGNYQEAFDLLLSELHEHLRIYHCEDATDGDAVRSTIQLSGLCRRSAGNLDWMPLVEAVLQPQSDDNDQKVERLRGKLLKIVLETLSGTTALSTVLEQILKHPLATSGTIGDIRQLLTGVLTHSRYEQVLVETTANLVSLELHETLKKSLRDAGRAYASKSQICPVCRQTLIQCADYTILFGCGHVFHAGCLGESKMCVKCRSDKGWAPPATNVSEVPRPRPPERRPILPPAFMRRRDLTLRVGAPTVLPDLEGIF